MDKSEYVKPAFTIWSSESIDSIESAMSYGGPISTDYCAYLLIASKSVAGLGHGALALVSNNSGTLFSFSGDVVNGALSTDSEIDAFLTKGIKGVLSSYSVNWSTFEKNPYIDPDTYDLGIKIKLTSSEYQNILSEAAVRLYKQSKKYSLLNFNCVDCALDLLGAAGIKIRWRPVYEYYLTTLASNIAEEFGVETYKKLRKVVIDDGDADFSIPVSVYDNYANATGYSLAPPTKVTFG